MIVAPTAAALARAADLLRAGELVGFPTETVYGLGADATNPSAVARIFAAKGRPNDHPVIVHVAGAADLDRWAEPVPSEARVLADRFWPGPLTLILPRAAGVPDAVTGGQPTVGVRSPSHPVARALLAAFAEAGGSGALAAPSANRFGRISPTRAAHVAAEFGEAVPLVLDGGDCDVGIESTILDLSRDEPVLLRPGGIEVALLQAALGRTVWLPDGSRAVRTDAAAVSTRAPDAPAPRASGTLAAHYAPRTRMVMAPAAELAATLEAAGQGTRLAVWSRARIDRAGVLWREAPADAAAYARALYATLREFDAAGVALIVLETPPDAPAWAGVHDRLARAVVGAGRQPG